jgi:predicted RecB family endonuclease
MSRGWTINHNGIEYIMADEYAAVVNHLAKKVKELEEVVMEQDEARVDLLAELINIRNTYGAWEDLGEELSFLINLHSEVDRKKANELAKVVI